MNNIPKFSEIYQSIISDMETQMSITIPIAGKSYLRALALVQAGKIYLLYLHLALVQKNIFVDTADPESKGGTLERFGRIKLGRNPFPATAAQYTITVTGTAGATINPGTTFISNDDSSNPGKIYVCDDGFVLSGSSGTCNIRAYEAGLDSQLNIGDELTATVPIANLNQIATIAAELVAPLAAEEIEDYRQKAIDAYRLEPQGGAASDYRLWAADAQGVQKVYPYAKDNAPGEINLYVEATIADSTDGKGTPTQAILDAVEEVVEMDPDTNKTLYERGRRPIGAWEIHFLPVIPQEVDIIIDNYTDLTAEKETAISDGLEADISEIRPFISGSDVLADKNDILDVNRIIAQILSAQPGSVFGTVTLKIDGVEKLTYTFIDGYIPHFNSVTFT